MAGEAGKKAGGGKKIGAVSLVVFFGLMVAVLVLPTTIVLAAGMLPTIVAALVHRAGKRTKILTVGAMNFAGCVPYLLPLWASDHSVSHALIILMDPRSLIVMYCAAGIGYLINWAMAGIVSTVMIQSAAGRLKDVKKKQAELVERWGPEVTGDLPLDAQGFVAETKPPANGADNQDE